MSTPLEDYALIGDCETAALVVARRLDRLAVLAALRLRRLLRRAARRRASTAAGSIAPVDDRRPRHPALSRRHADPRDARSRRRTARSRSSTSCRRAAATPTSSGSSRGERGRVRDADRARPALRLRPDGAVGQPPAGRHAAGDRRAGHGGAAHAASTLRGEDLTTVGEFEVAAGETVPFVLTHGVVASGRRRSRSTRSRRSTTPSASGRSGRRSARPDGRVGRRGHALADHAEGADLRADRRHRRGADDVAARAARRRRATGTTASAGCATRRSRCSR